MSESKAPLVAGAIAVETADQARRIRGAAELAREKATRLKALNDRAQKNISYLNKSLSSLAADLGIDWDPDADPSAQDLAQKVSMLSSRVGLEKSKLMTEVDERVHADELEARLVYGSDSDGASAIASQGMTREQSREARAARRLKAFQHSIAHARTQLEASQSRLDQIEAGLEVARRKAKQEAEATSESRQRLMRLQDDVKQRQREYDAARQSLSLPLKRIAATLAKTSRALGHSEGLRQSLAKGGGGPSGAQGQPLAGIPADKLSASDRTRLQRMVADLEFLMEPSPQGGGRGHTAASLATEVRQRLQALERELSEDKSGLAEEGREPGLRLLLTGFMHLQHQQPMPWFESKGSLFQRPPGSREGLSALADSFLEGTGVSDAGNARVAQVAAAVRTLAPGAHGFTLLMGPAEVAEREVEAKDLEAREREDRIREAREKRRLEIEKQRQEEAKATAEQELNQAPAIQAATPALALRAPTTGKQPAVPSMTDGDLRHWRGGRLVGRHTGTQARQALLGLVWRGLPADVVVRALFAMVSSEVPAGALQANGSIVARDIPPRWGRVLLAAGAPTDGQANDSLGNAVVAVAAHRDPAGFGSSGLAPPRHWTGPAAQLHELPASARLTLSDLELAVLLASNRDRLDALLDRVDELACAPVQGQGGSGSSSGRPAGLEAMCRIAPDVRRCVLEAEQGGPDAMYARVFHSMQLVARAGHAAAGHRSSEPVSMSSSGRADRLSLVHLARSVPGAVAFLLTEPGLVRAAVRKPREHIGGSGSGGGATKSTPQLLLLESGWRDFLASQLQDTGPKRRASAAKHPPVSQDASDDWFFGMFRCGSARGGRTSTDDNWGVEDPAPIDQKENLPSWQRQMMFLSTLARLLGS